MESEHASSNVLPPPRIDQFPAWRRAFERKMRERSSLQKRFSRLIEAGCDGNDLEEALWWVVLNLHFSESTTPTELRDFFALAETVLSQLEKLRPNLETLLNWHSQNKLAPGFDNLLELLDHLLPHLKIPQQRSRIVTIPRLINALYVLLKATHDMHKMDPRTIAAHAASVPEVLLFEYFRRATRSTAEMEEDMDQIREFQELAFEAYGVEGLHGRVIRLRRGREVEVIEGREYEGQTWARRYRRFKKADPKMQEVIVRVVEEFLTQKSGGRDISLVRFFVDSDSAFVRSRMLNSESSDAGRK
jgi:hypothetical protein